MKHFFRGTSDGVYFKNFSAAHFLLIAIALCGAYLIYKYKDVLREDRYSKMFKRTIGITLLSQQIILYMVGIFLLDFLVLKRVYLYIIVELPLYVQH